MADRGLQRGNGIEIALAIDLQSAARNVGRTVGGFAGELGEVIPELKDLTTEALQAGEGIDLLAEKFSGRAAADAKTFSGRIAQLSKRSIYAATCRSVHVNVSWPIW